MRIVQLFGAPVFQRGWFSGSETMYGLSDDGNVYVLEQIIGDNGSLKLGWSLVIPNPKNH